MSGVDDMNKSIKKLESMRDMKELCGKMQAAMSYVIADMNKEILALQASGATKDGELQACKAGIAACKVEIDAYKARIEAFEA